MKKSDIKIVAASPALRVCDTKFNTDNLINAAKWANKMSARILLFPELCTVGATAGDLYLSRTLTDSAQKELLRYAQQTRDISLLSFVGLPVRQKDTVYDCVAVISCGNILGIAPRGNLPRAQLMRSFSEPAGESEYMTFAGKDIPLNLSGCFDIDGCKIGILFDIYSEAIPTDLDVALCPMACPKTVGSYEKIKARAALISKRINGVCAVATAGYGESGTDALYDAQNAICHNGNVIASNESFVNEAFVFADTAVNNTAENIPEYNMLQCSPFIPNDVDACKHVFGEIFEIQSRALAGRIKRAYAKCAVIGVSGGLDSTLAVLVAARAMDILKMPRNAVKAVTMPCFGTTSRTKSNAERLSVALGADFLTVDIKRSVMTHFEDIGHDPEDFSVVYENAQARERTQVIMDIANAEGGMVIGTGDLSELVLGWATYNGDHMSMYGVNAGIPKTVIRHVTSYCADRAEADGDKEVAEVLRDVLNTPVSPELLPPKDGEIAQCTEGIVGPYELHDFFLYHLLKNSASPREIYGLAIEAFNNTEYTPQVIVGWLKVFFRRFFAQQFKRSCLPDGPMVYDISVSPRGGLVMPSDASAQLWIDEIASL